MISRITKNPGKLTTGVVKLLLVTALVLSILAVLATYTKVRVYNVYHQITELTHANPKVLFIISISLPFLALSIS